MKCSEVIDVVSGHQIQLSAAAQPAVRSHCARLAASRSSVGLSLLARACTSHGCIRAEELRFTAAAQCERKGVGGVMANSHLVVLKTPGMLLL